MSIEIIINEGKGSKLWKWASGMTEEQFVSWWTDMRDREYIKYYFNIKALDGKLTPFTPPNTEKTAAQRMPGDPSGYTPYYYCHFNEMEDSFIAINTEKIYYTPTSRRDWRELWSDWMTKRPIKPRNGYQNAR